MDGYIKDENGRCKLITCDEFPEITPGCVICSNKIDEYKPLNKCQSCKQGFFKTKDESCAFLNPYIMVVIIAIYANMQKMKMGLKLMKLNVGNVDLI